MAVHEELKQVTAHFVYVVDCKKVELARMYIKAGHSFKEYYGHVANGACVTPLQYVELTEQADNRIAKHHKAILGTKHA